MIEVDGSRGEGGGQLLRTSLALAALMRRALRLTNIRAGRSKPGLAPQHLTAVRALAAVCRAEVRGAELRATELEFVPAAGPQAGEYSFDVADAAPNGSAGSVTLLAQALLPVLAFAPGGSRLELMGGTHVRWSPSYEYFARVYLPQLRSLGFEVEAELAAPGFYPVGGGRIRLRVEPRNDSGLRGLELRARGELERIEGSALACNLPAHIPQRMTDRSRGLLSDLGASFGVQPRRMTGAGPGAAITLIARYQQAAAGFTAHGERDKPSEAVAEEACARLLEHHRCGAAVDCYLADQLLLPLALIGSRSVFVAERASGHLRTSAGLLQELLPVEIALDERSDGTVEVSVAGRGPDAWRP